VLPSFSRFMEDVVRDQLENRRGEDGALDEMWDESIKLKTQRHVNKDASTKTSTTIMTKGKAPNIPTTT
jgi:hypothetical protein